MKSLKTIIAIFSLAVFAVSCNSNDDDSPEPITYPEENPLNAYLTGSGFEQKTEEVKDAFFSEFGFSFKPTVNGKINALAVKMPDVNTTLKVTIWDVATKTAIRTEIVSIPTANVTVEKLITPIALIKGKEYYITRNSNDWYKRYRTDGSATTYPIVAGNITITGYAYIANNTGAPLFPTNLLNTDYAGDTSFKFQQTE
ncbi:MAG: hypothetical protein ABI793_05165 [Flavobacterium sp.]